MRPAHGPGVWRRSQRRAWRGTPRGRRGTHPVDTTYGRKQARAAWEASWAAAEAHWVIAQLVRAIPEEL